MDIEEQIDPKTARVAYRNLGTRHDSLEKVLQKYKEQGEEDTKSFQILEEEMARIRKSRGILKQLMKEEDNA